MGFSFNPLGPPFDKVSVETVPTGANPTASVGLAAINGSATTFLRSDGAPALDVSISPTWSGTHTFSNIINADGGVTSNDVTDTAWGIENQNLLDKTAAESITGVYTHENQIIIDITDTEAFLVRRNGDARDVFTIDTTNEDIIVGDGSLSGDRIVEMYNENTVWGAYGFDDSAGYFGIRVGDSTFNAATAELSIDLNKLGFFNQAPVAQPTGVAVTAAGIHSALVTLGLITA